MISNFYEKNCDAQSPVPGIKIFSEISAVLFSYEKTSAINKKLWYESKNSIQKTLTLESLIMPPVFSKVGSKQMRV